MHVDWMSVETNVVSTLQHLIRFDTSNPPGNERPCVEYIRDRLSVEGIESTVLEPMPGRASLIARLPGDGSERPLLLLSHVDVVPVEAEHWTHPPFSGVLADGYVWGRGAVDMKALTAIELEVFLLIKRLGLELKRDVILAATADEEAGGVLGIGWLADNHRNLFDAEYAINEGGDFGESFGGKWVFTCQTADKGICWTRVRARGEPGHGSVPRDQTAVSKLVAALDRIARARLPQHIVGTMEAYIHCLSEVLPPPMDKTVLALLDPETERSALDLIVDNEFAARLYACMHNTATPTILRAGEKINVIPSVAEGDVDCRIVPGQTVEDALAEIRAHLGDEVEVEILRASPGAEVSYDTPLFETIRQVMSELEPNSCTVPFMVPATSDGRYLARMGIKVYGLLPMKVGPGEPRLFELAHRHDERVSVDNLLFGTKALWEIVRRVCAK